MKKAITIIFLLVAALTVNGQAMLIRTQQDTLSLTGGTAVYIGPNRYYLQSILISASPTLCLGDTVYLTSRNSSQYDSLQWHGIAEDDSPLTGTFLTGTSANTYFVPSEADLVGDMRFYLVGYTEDYNPLALSLFARMDVQPSKDRRSLISMVFDTLSYYSIDDTLSYLAVRAAHDDQAATLNWLGTSYTSTTNNLPHFTDVGFKGNLYDAYIKTGFIPNSDSKYEQNNASYGICILEDKIENTSILGAVSSPTSAITFRPEYQANTMLSYFNDFSSRTNTPKKGVGLYILNRTASTGYNIYHNNTLAETVSATSTGRPTHEAYVLASNAGGTLSVPSSNIVALDFAGAALSEIQRTKLHEIFTLYFDSLNTYDYVFDGVYENDDFYYKRIDNDYGVSVNVLSQNMQYKLAQTADTLYLSADTGSTYPYKIAFAPTAEVGFVFSNGRLMVGTTSNQIYVSNDSLTSLVLSGVVDTDGSAYIPHTPANASYPGGYFHTFATAKKIVLSGNEAMYFGNYANADSRGAAPVNVYFMLPDDDSLRVAYKFGQNLSYRDNGTATGGTTGTILGDASNSIVVRHVHCQSQNPADSSAWVFTGDGGLNNRWMRGVFDESDSSWSFTSEVSFQDERYRVTGVYFDDDYVIWGDDGGNGRIYYSPLASINDTLIHEVRFQKSPVSSSYGLEGYDGNIINVWQTGNTIAVSTDGGNTFKEVQLKGLVHTNHNLQYILKPSADGWWKIGYSDKNIAIKFK